MSLKAFRMIGVVEMKVFNGDRFWHVAGAAEVML